MPLRSLREVRTRIDRDAVQIARECVYEYARRQTSSTSLRRRETGMKQRYSLAALRREMERRCRNVAYTILYLVDDRLIYGAQVNYQYILEKLLDKADQYVVQMV